MIAVILRLLTSARHRLAWALTLAASAAGAADLHVEVRNLAGAPMQFTVVIAEPTEPHRAGEAPWVLPRPVEESIHQIDKEFVPFVKVVPVGSLLHFPNHDSVRHHVYSFSQARPFDLPLYSGTAAPPIRFDRAGIVAIGCNIHDWMSSYVYVTDAPFFARTNVAGQASLHGLPPGRYRISVWHPLMAVRQESTARAVDVAAGVPITLNWQLELRPDLQPPRVPIHPASYD